LVKRKHKSVKVSKRLLADLSSNIFDYILQQAKQYEDEDEMSRKLTKLFAKHSKEVSSIIVVTVNCVLNNLDNLPEIRSDAVDKKSIAEVTRKVETYIS